MRRLSDTISRLRANLPANGGVLTQGQSERLQTIAMDRDNPGELGARMFVPAGGKDMPLVVVLHGCTQTADGYDLGSGWSALAERHGFAVLLPEQRTGNNPNRCFNWFQPADARRGGGEALSIRNLVAFMVDQHAIDPARVFVTGLSAGGAMASVMLATYPEVFAGGAIIAGLPFGTADTMPQAFDRMRGVGLPDASRSTALVRQASGHADRWPTVSVWHGTADATVSERNADAIIEQWQAVHGVGPAPNRRDEIGGAARRQWTDASGRVCLEDIRVPGMGHGTPLSTAGETACGSPMPYMLDVGVSSTWHIAANWGLVDPLAAEQPQVSGPRVEPVTSSEAPTIQDNVQATIEAALRSAGLLR